MLYFQIKIHTYMHALRATYYVNTTFSSYVNFSLIAALTPDPIDSCPVYLTMHSPPLTDNTSTLPPKLVIVGLRISRCPFTACNYNVYNIIPIDKRWQMVSRSAKLDNGSKGLTREHVFVIFPNKYTVCYHDY